ncbi:hypothetical protein [uncultured Aquimarina sp.]|uniref:hypothetical protein n=1 Tax=uncultured Aquimarina sp. TaxID=575652 RepID=UPI0026156111|nr:hypothetical protein [uncultured Aquimarina sp.]
MEILITKGKNRNTLTCKRNDGTWTSINLGPDIPNHDLAHYVVEKEFDLQHGFYGKIKSGMTIEQLSDKEIIKTLEAETWLSEIMARNLQAIGSGASNTDQFIQLTEWEARNMDGISIPHMKLSQIEKMKIDFDQLCKQWDEIPQQGTLQLFF